MTEKTGSNRVIRGGNWNNDAPNLRSANRNNDDPGNRNNNLGFRLLSTSKFFAGRAPSKDCALCASGYVQVIIQCQIPKGFGRITTGPQR